MHAPLIYTLSTMPATATDGRSEWLAPAMAAAGMLIVIVVLLIRMTKKRGASRRADRREASMSTKERMDQLRQRANTDDSQSAELRKMMLEARELTRECSAIIDTRAAKLERLIMDADERLARLDAAQRGEAAAPVHRRSTHAPSDAALGALGFEPKDTQVRVRHDALRDAIEPPAHNGDPAQQRVLALARQGLTPVQIAQELGEQIGRVELMLALNRA